MIKHDNAIDSQGGSYKIGSEYRWNDLIELVLDQQVFKGKVIKVLDVGCGEGKLCNLISMAIKKSGRKLKIDYYGVDIWPNYKKSINSFGGKFICTSFENLPKKFPKRKFDLIIASEIIEHVDETDLFINVLKNLLKPKGRIYLTTPNLASWHSRIMLLFGYLPLQMEVSNVNSSFGHGFLHQYYYGKGNNNTIHHIRCFTMGALIDFLRFHKLKIIKLSGGGYSTLQNILFKYMPSLSPVFKLICEY